MTEIGIFWATTGSGYSKLTVTFTMPDYGLEQSTFVVFPKLPQEIRDMIWELSIEGRVIRFLEKPKEYMVRLPYKNFADAYTINVLRATTDVPAILRTCQESRKVGLKKYELGLDFQLHGQKIYINFDKDGFDFDLYEDLKTFLFAIRRRNQRKFLLEKICHLRIREHCGFNILDQCKIWEMPRLSTLHFSSFMHWRGANPEATRALLKQRWAKKNNGDGGPTLYIENWFNRY